MNIVLWLKCSRYVSAAPLKVISMAITVMILDDDVNLRDSLINDYGLFSWISRNRTYALLHKKSGPCRVPDIVLDRDHVILLSLKEYGSSGFGQIVCGTKGQPLSPFLIREGKAYLKSSKQLITINYYLNSEKEEEIQIKKHIVKREANIVFVETQVLYTGDPCPPYRLRSFDVPTSKAVERGKTNIAIIEPLYIANT